MLESNENGETKLTAFEIAQTVGCGLTLVNEIKSNRKEKKS